jgi:dienelactone hydrolase
VRLLPLLFLIAACTPRSGSGVNHPRFLVGGDCSGGVVTSEITFPSSDGLVVHARVSNPCGGEPRPIVVLAHQMCRDSREWSADGHDWVGALGARGIATLAVDLRGHGASKVWPDGSEHDLCRELGTADAAPRYAAMVDDVRSAVAHARNTLGAPSVAVAGASVGANAALAAMAADPQVSAAVALSPGLDYRGIVAADAVNRLGSRPVFLLAAEDDARSSSAVKELRALNPALQTRVLPDGEHGNNMIDRHADELVALTDFLAAKLSQ